MATITLDTTMADYADRSLGIGYVGGLLILFAILMFVLALWRYFVGSVSVNADRAREVETQFVIIPRHIGSPVVEGCAEAGHQRNVVGNIAPVLVPTRWQVIRREVRGPVATGQAREDGRSSSSVPPAGRLPEPFRWGLRIVIEDQIVDRVSALHLDAPLCGCPPRLG
jgi:hypothetical protein